MNNSDLKAVGVIYPYPDHVHDSIHDLITSINSFGFVLTKEGRKFNGMLFKTTKELDEQLRDIPENEENFKTLSEAVPPFFMHQSIRGKDDEGTWFITIGDYDSNENE